MHRRNKLLHVAFEVLTAVFMNNFIFWDITSCSTLKVPSASIQSHVFTCHEVCLLPASYWFLLQYSSTLKIWATCSSETLIDFQRTTRLYIPEDRTLPGRSVSVRGQEGKKAAGRRNHTWYILIKLNLEG
jgi:hypothetical protein